MRTPGNSRGRTTNVNDVIRTTIINKINNENYNAYFPVTPIDDDTKGSKKKPLIIFPNYYDEL